MNIVICPNCHKENPLSALTCSGCGQNLCVPEAVIREIQEETPEQPQDAAAAGGEKQELLPLPEMPEESEREALAASKESVYPEEFAASNLYRTPLEAAGAFADKYLAARSGGQRVMLREDARKKTISSVILAAVIFLALSLRMLYHRNNFLWYMILAACVFCFWKFVLKDNNAGSLGKKLASMPNTEMESILMSEIDQTVRLRRVRGRCIGIAAAPILLVLILFWTPHMIFENMSGVVSLRFYTDSIVKETDVVIPDTWNGKSVTQIRGNVFENVTWIQTVKLPARLTVIRAHAFMGCSRLSEVIFPRTLREIGSSAFRRCYSLRTVTLPLGCSVNQKAFKESPTKIQYFSGE